MTDRTGAGPVGLPVAMSNAMPPALCGSLTFHTRGYIVSVCVAFGAAGAVIDPDARDPRHLQGGYVAITDNADPMKWSLRRRAPARPAPEGVRGAGVRRGIERDRELAAHEQPLLYVENNYGYQDPFGPSSGAVTAPGFARVDVKRRGRGCRKVWTNTTERGLERRAEAVHEDGPDLHVHARRELDPRARSPTTGPRSAPRPARPSSRSTPATASRTTTTTPAWASARTAPPTWRPRAGCWRFATAPEPASVRLPSESCAPVGGGGLTLAAPRASVGVTPKPVACRGGACRPANGNPTARGGDRVVAPDSARGSARGRCRPDSHVQVHPRATGLLGVASHRTCPSTGPCSRRTPTVIGCQDKTYTADTAGTNELCSADDGIASVDRSAQDQGGQDAARSHRRHARACRGRERLVQQSRSASRSAARDQTSGIESCTATTYSGPDSAAASLSGTCTGQGRERERPVPVRAEVRRDRPVRDRRRARALANGAGLVQPAGRASMSRAPTRPSGIASVPVHDLLRAGFRQRIVQGHLHRQRRQLGSAQLRAQVRRHGAGRRPARRPGRAPDTNGWYRAPVCGRLQRRTIELSGHPLLHHAHLRRSRQRRGRGAGHLHRRGRQREPAADVQAEATTRPTPRVTRRPGGALGRLERLVQPRCRRRVRRHRRDVRRSSRARRRSYARPGRRNRGGAGHLHRPGRQHELARSGFGLKYDENGSGRDRARRPDR